jgi:uncharacterized alpha/beta hydrolase family protein
MTKKMMVTVMVAFIVVATALLYQFTDSQDKSTEDAKKISSEKIEEAVKPTESNTPTIFIHGYKGSLRTFETMVKEFELKEEDKSMVTITVEPNGKLVYSEEALKQVKDPLVQLYFKNGTASVDDQLTWTKAAMKVIAEIYDTQSINIVAHSMGGLVGTKYIIETDNDKNYPQTEKFVTLASPLKGWVKYVITNPAEEDLHPNSAALASLYSDRNKFPKDVEVYSAYGLQDTLVGMESAKGLKEFTDNIITGGYMDNHSYIHEDIEVIDSAYSFLEFN